MLNHLWLGLLVLAALIAGFSGRLQEAVDGAVRGAEGAVTLALGLVGIMALWLGLMRLAERSGLVQVVARAVRPVLRRLFPDVPPDHPAMGSMVLNIAANMLGLNNAATPLGLRAMRDLETLNRRPGVASDAMCTFLAINTGSVQLLPVTAIAALAAQGASNPTAIVGSTLLATLASSTVGLVAVKLLARLPLFQLPPADAPASAPSSPDPTGGASAPALSDPPAPLRPLGLPGLGILLALTAAFAWFALGRILPGWPGVPADSFDAAAGPGIRLVNTLSLLAIPFLLVMFPVYAALRGLAVYDEVVEGAREGFTVALKIIPYLVAMLVAIGFFRGAGGIEILTRLLAPVLDTVGFPAELLPMALVRPLSGSGTLAVFNDLVTTHGADSLLARMGGTLFGSTETTFYVIAVYFGSVGIRRTRHAVWAGLAADAAGAVTAVAVCRWLF